MGKRSQNGENGNYTFLYIQKKSWKQLIIKVFQVISIAEK